jgi:hypothetical protein
MDILTARNLNLVDTDIVSIAEAKESGLIPDSYHSYLKNTCECGSDIVTTKNLTKQFCVDPNCTLKIVGRAMKTLSNFGIKGIGRAYCTEYFKQNPEFKSHLAILYGKRDNYYRTGRIADSDKLMENLYQIRTKGFTYSNLVSRMAIPDLCSRANLIFKKFNSYADFENFLLTNNLTVRDFLLSFEGIDNILASKLERNINLFKDDLIDIINYFKMKPSAQLHYELCLTGDMNFKSMTKKEYIMYLNMVGEGYVEFVQTEAKMRADYIVSKNANVIMRDADGEPILDYNGKPQIVDYTAKHNIGKERNITEGRKVLLDPEEMYNYVIHFVIELKKGVLNNGA